MGERKGVNKYYPPDYDPTKGGLNKFQGTHALRERARKLHLGILIIRFEMPYNIWCDGCENHIGTGVRYNAEKKKVGMYYSTPIYQFRMKCHLCDNHFEIKTDPAGLDYEIVSGARRQERRWDPTTNEQVVPEDKEVTRKMAVDAMFKLEHGVGDKEKSKEVKERLEQLEEFQTRRWHDDYSSNKNMRESMRVKRTKEQDQAALDASYNLSVPLLPANENDAKTAKLLQFTQSKTCDEILKQKRASIDAQSVFAKFKTKSISPLEKKAFARQSLKGIVSNSQKNFSNYRNTSIMPHNLGIVVKKADPEVSSVPSKDSTMEDNENVRCQCNVRNNNPPLPDNSRTLIISAPASCDHCNCSSGGKEALSSSTSERRENDPTSSTSGLRSEKIGKPLSPESSTADGESSSPAKVKVQSLVGYDFSGSDSD